jgi:uncharacterized membrane protein
MEDFLIAVAIVFASIIPLGIIIGSFVLAIMATLGVRRLRRDVQRQETILASLAEKLGGLEPASAKPAPEARPAVPAPAAAPEPAAAPPPGTVPEPSAPLPAPAPAVPGAAAAVSAPPPAAPARVVDKERWQRFEERVGKRWMIWAGMVVLFLAAGFFVKYAIDNKWLGPTGRVVLGILAGIALLVGGDLSARRAMRALGQGLMGGGLAILYVSLFAGFSLYDLFPQAAAFLSMIAITTAGMTLAILHRAIAVSILAVLGGMATPVMVSTGQDARDVLFAYLTLLDLGVLGVMFFKRWKALDILAFVGTMSLYAGWYGKFYKDASLLPAMGWLGGFFVIFLLAPFVYHLRGRSKIDVDRFILALANAAASFVFAYLMLSEKHPHALGFVALVMSCCYIVLGTVTRRRLADARSLFGFVALSVVFLTLAVPLHLKLSGITLAWAAEGPVLLFLGYAYRYMPVRIGGFLVLLCAVGRLIFYHMPLHEDPFVLLFNTRFASVLFVPLAGFSYAIIHHWRRSDSCAADRVFKHVSAILSGLLLVAAVQEEFRLWLVFDERGFTSWAVVDLAWAAGAASFLAAGIRFRALSSRITALPLMVIAAVAALVSFADDDPGRYLLLVNVRFAGALAAAAMFFACGFVLIRCGEICRRGEQVVSKIVLGAGLLFLLTILTIEAFTYTRAVVADPERAGWMSMMAISIVWSVFAAVLLAAGFWKRVRAMRFSALGLFFLTALKVAALDMASVKQIYRIISFFALGILMTGASYLYHVVEKSMKKSSGEKP